MKQTQEIEKRNEGPIANIRNFLANVDVKKRLENILGKRSAAFGNSIVNVVSGSKQLMEVAQNNPGSIMRAAMKRRWGRPLLCLTAARLSFSLCTVA